MCFATLAHVTKAAVPSCSYGAERIKATADAPDPHVMVYGLQWLLCTGKWGDFDSSVLGLPLWHLQGNVWPG